MKILKFRNHLALKILSGEKTVTWRLFDDKDLRVGDKLVFQNWNTGENFAETEIVEVREKKLGKLTDADFERHEKFESEEDMYQHYREYYGEAVNGDTVVKIVSPTFNLQVQ